MFCNDLTPQPATLTLIPRTSLCVPYQAGGIAYHSPLIYGAADSFRTSIEGMVQRNELSFYSDSDDRKDTGGSNVTVVSCLTGSVMDPALFRTSSYWADQMKGTVRFRDGLLCVRNTDVAAVPVLVEIGKGEVLLNLVRNGPGGCDCVPLMPPASAFGTFGAAVAELSALTGLRACTKKRPRGGRWSPNYRPVCIPWRVINGCTAFNVNTDKTDGISINEVQSAVLESVYSVLPNTAYVHDQGIGLLDTPLAGLGVDSLGGMAMRGLLLSKFGISAVDQQNDGEGMEEIPGNLLVTLPTARAISEWFSAYLVRRRENKKIEGGEGKRALDSLNVGSEPNALNILMSHTNQALSVPAGGEATVTASCMQQGMLFHGLMQEGQSSSGHVDTISIEPLLSGLPGGSRAFVETFVWRVKCSTDSTENNRNRDSPKLDVARFRAAWLKLLHAHPTLRTSYDPDATPRPTMTVWSLDQLNMLHPSEDGKEDWFQVVNMRGGGHGSADQEKFLQEIVQSCRFQGFDVRKPLLLRVKVVNLLDSQRVILTAHHCLFDGWSMKLMMRDLSQYYQQKEGIPSAVSSSYVRYALHEQALLGAETGWWASRRARLQRYWQDLIGDVLEAPRFLRPTSRCMNS